MLQFNQAQQVCALRSAPSGRILSYLGIILFQNKMGLILVRFLLGKKGTGGSRSPNPQATKDNP